MWPFQYINQESLIPGQGHPNVWFGNQYFYSIQGINDSILGITMKINQKSLISFLYTQR